MFRYGLLNQTICKIFAAFLLFAFIFSNFGCRNSAPDNLQKNEPQIFLWAWERPENLDFIDTQKFGVAYLAQTLQISNGEIEFIPRRQPLKLAPNTKLVAVTRIETPRNEVYPQIYNDEIRAKLLQFILKTAQKKQVSAIQIDFDAKVSERDFYRKLLRELRQSLPKNFGFSITVLASFCLGDNWIKDLPVDYVVPMVFRMGADDKKIKEYLANGNDFSLEMCRRSYGVAVDEPVKTNFEGARKIYVFNVKSWTENDLKFLNF